MERAYFFEGQQVAAEDLNAISDTLGEDMKNRTIDFFSKGVIGSNSDVFVLNDLNNTIKIEPFIAYTSDGERINMYKQIRSLAMDKSDPDEFRLRQQGTLAPEDFGWQPNTTYDIYIAYIEQGGRPKAQVETGDWYPTRVYTGFEFYAFRPGIDDDEYRTVAGTTSMVRLCRIITSGSTTTDSTLQNNTSDYVVNIYTTGYLEFSSIDASKVYTSSGASKPSNYNPVHPVSMQDHIMCVGSGTPTPSNPHGYTPADLGFDAVSVQTHETRMHASGIKGNRASVSSALYIGLNAIESTNPNTQEYDNLCLYNLSGDEQLHSNGSWLSSLAYSSNFIYIHFANEDGSSILPAGTYTFGIDPASGELHIGTSTATAEGMTVILTSESTILNTNRLGTVTVESTNTYNSLGLYSIAAFSWDPTLNPKPASTIVNTIPNSNFTTKSDLRTFGSTSPEEFSTTKQLDNSDVLVIPYKVQVDSLVLPSGVEWDGSSYCPKGFITGFNINYNTTNTIIVTPGTCRDSTDSMDIALTTNITKRVDTAWQAGGLTAAVGGLVNITDGPAVFNTLGDYALHIFVIRTVAGNVDIALDEKIDASNIKAYALTRNYTYIRRIGSVYVAKQNNNGTVLFPFSCVPAGQGMWIMYNTNSGVDKPYLTSAVYKTDTKSFDYSFVPNGYTFIGKFNYRLTNENAIYSTAAPAPIYLNGSGTVDIPVSDKKLYTQNNWSFPGSGYSLACLGYYDGRNV